MMVRVLNVRLTLLSFPGGTVVKNLPANTGDTGDTDLIPAGESGTPLQYSCLENPMDSGAWWAIVHSIAIRKA